LINFLERIGWFVFSAILAVVFYLILTPMAFVCRILGANFLDVKIDKKRTSYWISKETRGRKGKNV